MTADSSSWKSMWEALEELSAIGKISVMGIIWRQIPVLEKND